jgi:hypothetical protein
VENSEKVFEARARELALAVAGIIEGQGRDKVIEKLQTKTNHLLRHLRKYCSTNKASEYRRRRVVIELFVERFVTLKLLSMQVIQYCSIALDSIR